jgi:hypothetical protein
MPTFMEFFLQHIWVFLSGAFIACLGFLGAILFIRNQAR